jgi:hypothetical protein
MAVRLPIQAYFKPIPTPPDWVRPADWPVITDSPDEVQFLVADTGAKAFAITTTFIKNSGTNIYIDWGDGVIDTISTIASTTTNHVYSTGGTPCSRGYNTFKIRVYGDPTCKITNARHGNNFAVTGGGGYYGIGVLEAYFGDNTCNTTAFGNGYFNTVGNNTFPAFIYLEYVKFPSVVSWTSQLSGAFWSCNNIHKIIMPTSASALTDLSFAFYFCPNLLDITLPSDATGITNLSTSFTSCTNLRSISFPTSLNSCTNLASAFLDCESLKNITLPSINLVTNFTNAFSSCYSLQWIKFTSLPSPVSAPTSVLFNNTFQGCHNLQNVYFPATCSSNAVYSCISAFNTCASLKSIVFPTNFNISSLSSAFGNCFNITSIIIQSATPNLTSITDCFGNCYLLNSITLPTTVSPSGISMNNAFSACTSLTAITIPSGWLILSLSATFQLCYNITSITLPNNAQNSCTTMALMANRCYKLETIVMPTSLNLVNSLASIFLSCFTLKSVIFPATMNAVTSMQSAFQLCYNLESVTLPTSMSACTSFQQSFPFCNLLTTVTMPTTVSSSLTTYSALVQNCRNLKTLTLPTTQTSSLTSIVDMFSNCGNLTTVTNLDKLGSLTSTPLINASIGAPVYTNMIESMSFNSQMSKFLFAGSSTTTNFSKLNSLRMLNASAGQWTGTSPQINVSFTSLSTAALVTLFNDIAAQGIVVGKTINITSATGAAGLTAANRLILTSRGWTIIG